MHENLQVFNYFLSIQEHAMPEESNGMDSAASRMQKTAKARQDPKFHFSGGLMCATQTSLVLDLVPVEHSQRF